MTSTIEIPTPQAKPVELDPAHTILIIIDMCNETCHPDGTRYGGELVARTIPAIASLRQKVRAAGGKIIHTQSVRQPDALEFKMGSRRRLLVGSWGVEFVDPLKPATDEFVVVKQTHDCFFETDLQELLVRLGAEPGKTNMLITGHAARSCVQYAVMGMSVRNYWVYAPMDCIGQEEEREIVLAFDMFSTGGYRHNTTLTHSDLIRFV